MVNEGFEISFISSNTTVSLEKQHVLGWKCNMKKYFQDDK